MHHRKKPPSLYIITARTNDPIKTANPDIFEILHQNHNLGPRQDALFRSIQKTKSPANR